MRISDSETRLSAMLDDVRWAKADRNPSRDVVDVFSRFARMPVTDAAPASEDGDGLLAEFGTYKVDDHDGEFQVSLTRQYIESREDAHMWQLSCSMYWANTPETASLGAGEVWSFGLDLRGFFAQMRRLPGWDWALRTPEAPVRRGLTFSLV